MRLRSAIFLFAVLAMGCGAAFAADDVKLDAAKYPQDTPENALATVAKVLEGEDYAYWITWVMTPDATKRTLDKYKTLDAAAAAGKTEEAKVKGRAALLEAIAKVQKDKKTQEGTENQVSWVRFAIDDTQFLQFEKQPDGRWCFNPKARAAVSK